MTQKTYYATLGMRVIANDEDEATAVFKTTALSLLPDMKSSDKFFKLEELCGNCGQARNEK